MKEFWKTLKQTCARLGIKPTARVVFVSIATQTLQLFDDGKLVRSHTISTSKRPPSNLKDSLGTPRGLHEIAQRIGDGQPPGMVFKSRRPTGFLFDGRAVPPKPPCESCNIRGGFGETALPATADAASTALVTTRILWLRGLEPGVNLGGDVDSHDRYIYIHGTNREDLIGTPQSAGCVVMRNLDIIDLFDQVRAGDMVLIG